jgi:hypothetical protein
MQPDWRKVGMISEFKQVNLQGEKKPLGRLGVDGRTILEWILKE